MLSNFRRLGLSSKTFTFSKYRLDSQQRVRSWRERKWRQIAIKICVLYSASGSWSGIAVPYFQSMSNSGGFPASLRLTRIFGKPWVAFFSQIFNWVILLSSSWAIVEGFPSRFGRRSVFWTPASVGAIRRDRGPRLVMLCVVFFLILPPRVLRDMPFAGSWKPRADGCNCESRACPGSHWALSPNWCEEGEERYRVTIAPWRFRGFRSFAGLAAAAIDRSRRFRRRRSSRTCWGSWS